MQRSFTMFLAALFVASLAEAQIKVNINSGNPKFPFPQFLPYQHATSALGNLGTKNGAGVSHAEMEQTIRDAYQIMMNRATKPGGGVGGIDYILFRSNPSCSEGSGYAMLAAAAMADKTMFDGLWLYIHDYAMNKVKRYSDGQMSSPGYLYSQLPGWTNAAGGNSATDGDVDIGYALLCAYFQWGEFMGINDATGNPISYKKDAIAFLKALTDTLIFASNGNTYISGDVGLDGYLKNGDTWNEVTDWASNTGTSGFLKSPNFKGPTNQYVDYSAPSYFHQFADFLAKEDPVAHTWNIKQFQRCEASSDWILGQMLPDPKMIPYAGKATVSGNSVTFSQFSDGEDFRLSWRTILNFVWHGNPTSTWDPAAHQVKAGAPNSYERDIGTRYAKFLWDTRQAPWGNPGITGNPASFSFWGPSVILYQYDMYGRPNSTFYLNWIQGTGSPSAVTAQDFDLMAEMYRQCEIEWDIETPGDLYLTSVPKYFHGWYRLLGLLVLSGNYQPPSAMKPSANMKVYLDISKTFGFQGDSVTYTIDYRNYGSVDAENVVIVDTLHKDFIFLSASNGGIYNAASNIVTWNIGTVPGFKTAGGISPTAGQVKLVVKVGKPSQKQYRNRVTIACANGPGCTSNEYPNVVSAVMKRNYLDIAKRAGVIDIKASQTYVKPGTDVLFTISFKNTSEAGWIDGGRQGVQFAFSQSADNGSATSNTMRMRLFHDADEAYIDFGNYRISYFLYDSVHTGSGWGIMPTITEGIPKESVRLLQENIMPGQDSLGRWNQRLVVQFSDPAKVPKIENLATVDHHLQTYAFGAGGRVHRGGTSLLRLVWMLHAGWMPLNWSDDWSWDPGAGDQDGGKFHPVTPDWTDPDKPNIPVTTWNPKNCEKATHTVNNVLVEEWDGYTWRRVAGNGPLPGRDLENVVITDTIPDGFTFVSFQGASPLGIAPSISGNIITWSIPKLQINQGGEIIYTAKAGTPAQMPKVTKTKAWITATKESPTYDSVIVIISDTIIKPAPDHLDICLDTAAIDSSGDNPFVSITMDAGTTTASAYAVVRDQLGGYIRRATAAVWTSRNTGVVTAAGQPGNNWAGSIVKAGPGSTIVVVNEPGLKPDSMAITAAETPPWPAISTAVMYDNNADIVPDALVLTLTKEFQANQRLDSVVVSYRGTVYAFAAGGVTLQGAAITVPFASLTVVDAKPAGTATMVMTVDNGKKSESRAITDGVSPALVSADVLENDGTLPDVLFLAFTESINSATLIGKQLSFKKAGGNPVTFTVTKVLSSVNDSIHSVEVSASDPKAAAGDSLRLVPGSAGGGINDGAKNKPHDLNKWVVIGFKAGAAPIAAAWYLDTDADGVLDRVVVRFRRKVQISDFGAVKVQWKMQQHYLTLTNSTNINDSTWAFPLVGSATSPGDIATGGAMDVIVEYSAFPNIPRSAPVADSAAPVLSSALLTPDASGGTNGKDTLVVVFSEEVANPGARPFQLAAKKDGSRYRFLLTSLGANGVNHRFVVESIDSGTVAKPSDGDSIWIRPEARVGDKGGVVQLNPLNRRVLLRISWPEAADWDLTLSSNPFTPGVTVIPLAFASVTGPGKGLAVLVQPKPVSPVDPVTTRAAVEIFDATGTAAVKADMRMGGESSYYFVWDGFNGQGRAMGTGTYLLVVKISGTSRVLTKKMKIGIKR